MVFPASSAHDALDSASGEWIRQIQLSLRLSRSGVLVLVDRARPERLGELVRALYAEHPKLDVLADVRSAAEAEEGSVLVLVPTAEDASWLNARRPVFSRLELKVVLWCEEAVSAALARHASDFFDWVTQRQECPRGVVSHAVFGIRAAVDARAPGIVWRAAPTEETKRQVEETVAEAIPDYPQSDWLVPTRDYARLLEQLDAAKEQCALIAADTPAKVRRARWALAESKRTFPAVVVTDVPMGGYFPVSAECLGLVEARNKLEEVGVARPGSLAAVLGLEPEAIDLACLLLKEGMTEREIGSAVVDAEDPGAALAKLGWRKGLVTAQSVIEGRASAPVQRVFVGHPEVVHGREKWLVGMLVKVDSGEPIEREQIDAWAAYGATDRGVGIVDVERFFAVKPDTGGLSLNVDLIALWLEPALRHDPTNPALWIRCATYAILLGEGSSAALWCGRAFATSATEEALEEVVTDWAASAVRDLEKQGLPEVARLLTQWYRPLRRQHRMSNVLTIGMIISVGTLLVASVVGVDSLFPWLLGAMFLFWIAAVWFRGRARRLRATSATRWTWLGLRPGAAQKVSSRTFRNGTEDEGFTILLATLKQLEEAIEPPLAEAEKAHKEGRLAEAETVLNTLVATIERDLGNEHPYLAKAKRALAFVLFDADKPSETLSALETVFASETTFATDPDVLLLASRTLAKLGRWTDAERALRHLVDAPPPADADTSAAPDHDETDPILAHLLRSPRGVLRAHPEALEALRGALSAQGRHEEARILAESANIAPPERIR